MNEFRVNKGFLCFIPFGAILFMFGGVSSMWIFPFNFIITLVAIMCFFIYPIHICYKKKKQEKILKYTADLIECRTHGIIRIEFSYDMHYNGYNRRARGQRILRYMIAKVIESKLVYYNQNNMNNNGIQNPYQNPMYPQGMQEPLIHNQGQENRFNNHHYPQYPQNPPQKMNPQNYINNQKNLPPQYPNNQGHY